MIIWQIHLHSGIHLMWHVFLAFFGHLVVSGTQMTSWWVRPCSPMRRRKPWRARSSQSRSPGMIWGSLGIWGWESNSETIGLGAPKHQNEAGVFGEIRCFGLAAVLHIFHIGFEYTMTMYNLIGEYRLTAGEHYERIWCQQTTWEILTADFSMSREGRNR